MSAPPPSSRPRILLVDDDELVRRALRRSLDGQADVLSAESSARARELLSEGPFDVVVSDHSMQGETGMSLLTAVASRHPHAALILFSALPPPEAYRALGEGLLDALFHKPSEAAALVDFVLRAIAPPVAEPAAHNGEAACEIDLSGLPLARVTIRRTPTDGEWAEVSRLASDVVSRGRPYVLVFEVAAGAIIAPDQLAGLAEWQSQNRVAVNALCLGIALVAGPGPNRSLHASVRHAGPLDTPIRRCASRDEALAWANGRLAAAGGER
jgi:CheY-like chemotaxis protein